MKKNFEKIQSKSIKKRKISKKKTKIEKKNDFVFPLRLSFIILLLNNYIIYSMYLLKFKYVNLEKNAFAQTQFE